MSIYQFIEAFGAREAFGVDMSQKVPDEYDQNAMQDAIDDAAADTRVSKLYEALQATREADRYLGGGDVLTAKAELSDALEEAAAEKLVEEYEKRTNPE